MQKLLFKGSMICVGADNIYIPSMSNVSFVLLMSVMFLGSYIKHHHLREWSLITGRGGLQNGRGGHVKFYPYKKGGRKKF